MEVIDVETALEMHEACMEVLPVDIAIMAAAVSDWRVQFVPDQKMKKSQHQGPLQLTLIQNPDILAEIAQHSQYRPKLVIGFAAETENIEDNALQKLKKKKCDWIIANDVSASTGIMGGEENQLQVFTTHSKVSLCPKVALGGLSLKILTYE
ncbi:phosphopantothenoylcysteine decarboxylase domain-containing protein [Entomobacter blattae]|uniref:Coenzyme A biosynthesis bifunctional protein CoaBC n=1 Tax=Entomobacter blattae TaxID=2762277 RepID=A0A7H1NQD9_9PROT|nr:phosphopantothenoylcysteine decarboxylase [Entomobacter blattae]QNT77999.1 Coenzyme A biosynthesis bifunctional protein CoaBC [Entomobacter blattae]